MKKKLKAAEAGQALKTSTRIGGRSEFAAKADGPRIGRRKKSQNAAINDLATALKELREEAGISRSKLAKQLDIAPATLVRFEEKGQSISLAVVIQIVERLKCSLQVVKN